VARLLPVIRRGPSPSRVEYPLPCYPVKEGDVTLPEHNESFVHLHVHSEYSLLDGFCRLPQLVQRAKQLGMPAIALTDHGALYGAVDFYRLAIREGIKPIIGLEAYLAPRGMQDRDPHFDSQAFHLLLLVENDTGYRKPAQDRLGRSAGGLLLPPPHRPRLPRRPR